MIHSARRTTLTEARAEARLPTSIRPGAESMGCMSLPAFRHVSGGSILGGRPLHDHYLCASDQSRLNGNVRNPLGNRPVVKLILPGQIDALHKDRRALGQVAGLAHGNTGLAIEPKHAID